VKDFNKAHFIKNQKYYLIALVLILVMGFAVRMIDLKDPPLAYHPTRQLRAAIIARNIYYQINPGASPDNVDFATDPALYDYVSRREPPITESTVAILYLLIGSELLWVSRIVTALFWCVGGIGLYLLVSKLASKDAGLISLSFYLFAPFGVIASRSFQPEALMVASIIWSILMFLHWLDKRTWRSLIVTAVLSGFAILVKPTSLFFLLPVFTIGLISSEGIKGASKNFQAWVLAGISAVIPAIFYVFINPAAGGFLDNWWTDITHIIPTSRYFLGWGSIITDVVPFPVLVLAFASTLLFEKNIRRLIIGLWVGYVVLGVFVPHHIYTHDYYSIILVPIAGISLGKIAQVISETAVNKSKFFKIMLIALGVVALAYPAWNVYKELREKDFRGEPGGWVQISTAIPDDQKTIALTHNYGFNMAYYGNRMLQLWPYASDFNLQSLRGRDETIDFDTYFRRMTGSSELFLVTHFGELNSQPLLMEKLSEMSIYDEGPGYILYDLSSRK